MSDIPSFPYRLLWEERGVVSVANLTRADGEEFLALAPRVPVRTTTTPYPLDGRTRRSTICARAGSRARPCSSREARPRPERYDRFSSRNTAAAFLASSSTVKGFGKKLTS